MSKKKVLSKFMILCWATFIAILGCTWSAGLRLDPLCSASYKTTPPHYQPPSLPVKMRLECAGGWRSCHFQLLLWKLKPLEFSVWIQKESFKKCVCVCMHICRYYTYIYINTHLYIHIPYTHFVYMYICTCIYFIYTHANI